PPLLDAPVAPECVAAAEDTARLLTELGHSVEEATPPWQDERMFRLFMAAWEVSPALYDKPPGLIEPMTRALIEPAEEAGAPGSVLATAQLRGMARQIVASWDDYGVVLTAPPAQPPVPIGGLEDEDPWQQIRNAGLFTAFTQVANMTGLPAVSLPLF